MSSVTLIDHMGSDLTVVNAARVSFAKQSDWDYLCNCGHYTDPTPDCPYCDKALSNSDARLINYLAEHNHRSPFNHCFISFHVKAPVFVARQLVKHEYLTWNEVSRRYVDYPPEFHEPDEWRKKAEDKKQGSSTITVDNQKPLKRYTQDLMHAVQETYHYLLSEGVCPEQARMILPQSMMTEWYWSGSLGAFVKMCKLRCDPHAQEETRAVAKEVLGFLEALYPVSTKALMKELEV